jgi:hypothetical protein
MTFTGTTSALNAALANLAYIPTSGYSGGDALTVVTDDQGNSGAGGPLSQTATVAISVALRADDPPTIGVPGSQTTATIGVVFSARSGNAIIVDSHDPLNRPIVVTVSATSGLLSLDNRSGATFTTGDGVDDRTFTLRGSEAEINAALEGLRFTAQSTYGSIEVRATDGEDNTSAAGLLRRDGDRCCVRVDGGRFDGRRRSRRFVVGFRIGGGSGVANRLRIVVGRRGRLGAGSRRNRNDGFAERRHRVRSRQP